MNHKGEISRLSRAVEPDVAVITNIGSAHIGNLGSREAIASAKLEILDGLTTNNLIIPHGEPLFNNKGRFRTISVNGNEGDCALLIHASNQAYTTFSFRGEHLILENERIALSGAHLLTSLAFALSVADVLGVAGSDIQESLKSIDQSLLRQRRLNIGRYKIYDDTYSSSPEAAAATIKALTQQFPGSVSAVLGDMLELGEHSAPLHNKLGKIAAECGIRRLYLFGSFSEHVKTGALSAGMDEDCIFTNTGGDIELTANNIRESYNGELLIVKASHNVHAERLFDFLKD